MSLRPETLGTSLATLQLQINGSLRRQRSCRLALFRQTLPTAPGRNPAIQCRQTRVVDHLRAFGDFDGVLQFVRGRCDHPVFDGVLRVQSDPDVAIAVRSGDSDQARTNAPAGALPHLHEHDDVRMLKRVDQSFEGG